MTPSAPTTGSPVSLSRLSAFVIIVGVFLFAIIWAKSILVPLVFAVLFALTLRPVANWVEYRVGVKWLSVLLTFIIAAVPIAGAILLFSYQTIAVLDDIPTITEELQESLNRIFARVTEYFAFNFEVSGSVWLQDKIADALDEPFVYVRGLVAGGAGLVGTLLLIFLYTFLLLLYRKPIHHFILGQFGEGSRSIMEEVMADTQLMSYTYLKGLGTVMLILGVANSIGLYFIGVDYAFFWGFLAAFLAIIPYVGTFIGGLLPFVYTLSTTETTWQPIAVIVLFLVVQTVEGNIITPKVVGSSIRVNPLAAIIALFFGGFIWGVEGLILALPITAMMRIVLVHSTRFRPFGLLLSDDLADRDQEFLGALDQPHYRVINFFRPIARGVYEATPQQAHFETHSEVVNPRTGRRVSVDVDIDVDERELAPSDRSGVV